MNANEHRLLSALAAGAKLEQDLQDAETWYLDTEWVAPNVPIALYKAGLIQRDKLVIGYWRTPHKLTAAGRAAAAQPYRPTWMERLRAWLFRDRDVMR